MSWENYFAKGFASKSAGSTMIEQKMLTKERMHEMMEYLAGSCHIGGIQSAVETAFKCELITAQIKQLEEFLENNECYECEYCGWQTHPGEGCDCDESNDEDEDNDD